MATAANPDYESMIENVDIQIFEKVYTETSYGDRRSLLTIERLIGRQFGEYSYLEIGSSQGGSLQPHLVDRRCRRIYSIDPRLKVVEDDRGRRIEYPENTTERMLANLSALATEPLSKIVSFESDAREVDRSAVNDPPHLCFIDGEHTESAVVSDFAFCRAVARPDATILFHDSMIVFPALRTIEKQLRREGVPFSSAPFHDSLYAITLGTSKLLDDPSLASQKSWAQYYNNRLRILYYKYLGGLGHGMLRPFLAPLFKRMERR